MSESNPQSSQSGSVFVIFGASGGIGSQVVRDLAGKGNHVLAVGRDKQKLHEVLPGLSGVEFAEADISQPSTFDDAVAVAGDKWGKVDGVANCIGGLLLKPAHLTSLDEWNNQLLVHATSSFLVLKSSLEALKKSRGSLVLISSVAAARGFHNHEAVAAGKAAVEGLVLSAAATYAPSGVRVNGVAPGLVMTPLTSSLLSNENMQKASAAMHPLNRIGSPGDISSAVCWLLDPHQSWITGQIIHIDGGMSSIQSRNRA